MKKAKAIIAIPSISDFYTTTHRLSALGEKIVEKILQNQGWDTRLMHFPIMGKQTQPLPPSLSHLKNYLIPGEFGPTSFFSRYQRFGPSPKESAAIILSENPHVVFLSCFAFAYADDTLSLARHLKRQSPSVPVYVGGAGVSVFPGYFEAEESIDAVIPGEAESALTAFLGGNTGPDRSTGPHIERPDSIDFSIAATRSSKNGQWLTTTLTRGCPRKCSFCANHLAHGRSFRTVPIDAFLSTIQTFPKDIPLHINFEDDNLLLDKDYFFAILEAIRNQFPLVDFSAENGMDYLLLDIDTAARLIALGFRQFNLSMASLSPSILKDSHRQGNPEHLQEILRYLSRKKIPSITYFICGLKQDTTDSVLENIRFLSRQTTRIGISLFYPVPGLPGFKDTQPFFESDSHLCTGSAAFPWSESLTTAQMITAFRLARFVNFTHKKAYPPQELDLLPRLRHERKLYTFQRNG
ncbi:MAG: radical SAM protein, partial [Deltaproteobacteria bacterium]|nr:radical SAM protein [Deltaproteobacteria bacterium]